jgi:hypothetical protein
MKFNVRLVIDIDEEENILPVLEDMYEDFVKDYLTDLIYDIDGAKIKQIEVKRK